MDTFELELKKDFLEEASQFLSEAENYYLELEDNPSDANILNDIFRLVHNIKGSSKAVGFDDLGAFTHEFEHLLTELKNKVIKPSSAIVDLLLKCNDHLNEFIVILKQDMNGKLDSSELIDQIKLAVQGDMQTQEIESVPSSDAFDEGTIGSEDQFFVPSNEDIPDVTYDAGEEMLDEIEKELDSSIHMNEERTGEEKRMNEASSAQKNLKPSQDIRFEMDDQLSESEDRSSQSGKRGAVGGGGAADGGGGAAGEAGGKTAGGAGGAAGGAGAANFEESIRISLLRLDKLINYVGELVVLQAVMKELTVQQSSNVLKKTVHQMGKVTKEIQDISMGLRMIPLKQTFQKMQRIVRDTSSVCNKKINLVISGEETEVDKTVLESLNDPLVHIIRNAVDHGVETPESRTKKGKSEAGRIQIRAFHQSSKLVIEISDDGGGINPDILYKKAIEKGVIRSGAKMTRDEIIHLVFHPGFSTKSVATEVSGRGVGMDVVKSNIERIQGEIQIETEVDKGTKFRIILPLTLAIIDGMIISSSHEKFVIPLSHVHETVRMKQGDLQKSSGLGNVLLLRGETIPIYFLHQLLGRPESGHKLEETIAIIVRSQDTTFAVLVDDILGQHQVVVKKLGDELKTMKGFSGSTILGDGRPALILEVEELITSGSGISAIKRDKGSLKGAAA